MRHSSILSCQLSHTGKFPEIHVPFYVVVGARALASVSSASKEVVTQDPSGFAEMGRPAGIDP